MYPRSLLGAVTPEPALPEAHNADEPRSYPSLAHAIVENEVLQWLIDNAEENEDRATRDLSNTSWEYAASENSAMIERARTVSQFNNFRIHSLEQDIETPFNGEDMVLYFSTIIRYMRESGKDQSPSTNWIIGQRDILVAYGHWKWSEAEGFKFEPHDSEVINVWMEIAANQGRLTREVPS